MNYEVEQEIVAFFEKTTTTRSACDNYASEHLSGNVTPVDIQGVCSYTVYAGPNAECVVQYRLKSLALNIDIMNLAKAIYGSLTPQISFKGQIGEAHESKEPLYIYVMNRMPGISHLDFILAHNAPKPCGRQRKLLDSLPIRFHPLIKKSLDSLPAIFSLPMVLLHNDFGSFNMLVDENSCNLLGVIDWAEAEIAPFGINLYALDRLISKIHLKHGWSRYDDYRLLDELFWTTFSQETGVDNETINAIKAARITGVLLCLGFISRLPNEPKPVPISDADESGAYGMRDLDGLLINPATRFTDLV
ncbi:hypothetical protein N7486_000631 [Penicillium sp. IBT 16267x]|nr:hypothetical protein N7486_000631 [Penicillium sp. IBT 16267x]